MLGLLLPGSAGCMQVLEQLQHNKAYSTNLYTNSTASRSGSPHDVSNAPTETTCYVREAENECLSIEAMWASK